MSDNEYERFEITNYDLENEFNTRPRRHLTRSQQIYGIFGDDSDDEINDSRHGRHGRRGLGSGPRDYTAPVSFVAGGVQQSGKKVKVVKDEEVKKDTLDDQITDDEEDCAYSAKQAELENADKYDSSESDEYTPPPKETISFKPNPPAKVGAWEQHTRGIGAKLLLQMGYEPGKGLGKDLQGISQPVEAYVRKGRGAIGAYGPEKKATIGGKQQVQKEDPDVREARQFKERVRAWKKGADPQATRQHYYKTAEEVIAKGKSAKYLMSANLSKRLGNVPVIDMTGPEKRVLSGYHALSHARIPDDDYYDLTDAQRKSLKTNFDMPELKHNLDIVINMCEQEIISIDQASRAAADNELSLSRELRNVKKITVLEKDHIETLEGALSLVYELMSVNTTPISLERAENIFLLLQHKYTAEYKEFKLGDLAAGVIAPLIKRALETWRPLDKPTYHINTIKRWRSILNMNKVYETETGNVFDPYSSIVWAGVIPSFRICAATWNPREHQAMAALLDAWAPLFPNWVLDSVLEQLILPRLAKCVLEWDPLTDTVPIHLWILPWNAILANKMEDVIYPTIREKLAFALLSWTPQDRSAHAMLLPWKSVFNPFAMQAFLSQHILPKLQMVLHELVINPMDQNLELWHQVWEWHDILPMPMMSHLLEKHFFPKWMQVLMMWLNQSPNFVEVSRWYTGWKKMFPSDFITESNIRDFFRRALEIMHRATDTFDSDSNPSTSTGSTTPPPTSRMKLQTLKPTLPSVQLDFKQVVSQKCAERGIIFMPLVGRRELGKQVYRVGKLYCYIDRNICMLSDNTHNNWTPTPLNHMLERAMLGTIK